MPQLSTVKNALQSTVRKDRLLNAIFAGGKTILVSLGRTLYALWLQTTGLVFAVFTVMAATALVRQYQKDHFVDRQRLWLTGAFALVCLWFTLVSFRRAKKTVKAKAR
jgi:RsiW-degrading membrane proteinase PrsW (M82 family)